MPPTPLDFTLVAPSKVYDSTVQIVSPVIDTVVPDPGAADVTFLVYMAAYADADVGAGIACTANVLIQGPDAALFTVASVVVPNGEITARPITVTADAKTKMRTANDPDLTYAVTAGALQGADEFAGALTRDAGETVGDYNITQGTLSAGTNYTITFVAALLSIFALATGLSGVITEPLRYRIQKASPPANGRWSRWKRRGRENYGS